MAIILQIRLLQLDDSNFGDIVCRDWHVSRDMDCWMHQQRAVQDTRLKDQNNPKHNLYGVYSPFRFGSVNNYSRFHCQMAGRS